MVTKGLIAARLERQIGCVKYTIFSLNAILWILGCGMFGLAVWMRIDPGFQEWVDFLELQEFYIGVYILIIAAVFVMIIAFFGCAAALMEHTLALYVHIGLQCFGFILGLAGAAVLLDYSTYDSHIQPVIRKSITTLIVNSQFERPGMVLRMIQESVGCCGADGPMDYLTLYKPLPTECRDTVTGNAFFHGCIEELTWFLESRSGWLAGLALALCMLHCKAEKISLFLGILPILLVVVLGLNRWGMISPFIKDQIHVVQAVLSLILIQAKQKEDEAAIFKR